MNRIGRILKNKLTVFVLVIGFVVTQIENIEKLQEYIKPFNPFIEENQESPITIGMSIEKVETLLGKPHEVSVFYSSYFSHGLKISSDYEDGTLVGGVTASKLKSGRSYKGTLQGIKLGMDINQVNDVLGKPDYWGISSNDLSTALWENGDFITIVHYTPDKNEKWNASEITHAKPSSIFTYESILNAAIQELKAGRIPKFLDELHKKSKVEYYGGNGILKLDEFIRDYLHLESELLMIQSGDFGGAYLTYGYQNGKVLRFWIYPLGWKNPEIRTIIDYQKFADAFHDKRERT